MAGNVWEWTTDLYTRPDRTPRRHSHACCDGRRASPAEAHPAQRVIKGGSHLCAPNYCLRYRPAARQGETVDTSTSHLGFRCVSR